MFDCDGREAVAGSPVSPLDVQRVIASLAECSAC